MPAPIGPPPDARVDRSADGRSADLGGSLGPWRYEFLVPGQISAATARAFPEPTTTPAPLGGTGLHGEVRDQAHLHGSLARFDDLGLVLVETRRLSC